MSAAINHPKTDDFCTEISTNGVATAPLHDFVEHAMVPSTHPLYTLAQILAVDNRTKRFHVMVGTVTAVQFKYYPLYRDVFSCIQQSFPETHQRNIQLLKTSMSDDLYIATIYVKTGPNNNTAMIRLPVAVAAFHIIQRSTDIEAYIHYISLNPTLNMMTKAKFGPQADQRPFTHRRLGSCLLFIIQLLLHHQSQPSLTIRTLCPTAVQSFFAYAGFQVALQTDSIPNDVQELHEHSRHQHTQDYHHMVLSTALTSRLFLIGTLRQSHTSDRTPTSADTNTPKTTQMSTSSSNSTAMLTNATSTIRPWIRRRQQQLNNETGSKSAVHTESSVPKSTTKKKIHELEREAGSFQRYSSRDTSKKSLTDFQLAQAWTLPSRTATLSKGHSSITEPNESKKRHRKTENEFLHEFSTFLTQWTYLKWRPSKISSLTITRRPAAWIGYSYDKKITMELNEEWLKTAEDSALDSEFLSSCKRRKRQLVPLPASAKDFHLAIGTAALLEDESGTEYDNLLAHTWTKIRFLSSRTSADGTTRQAAFQVGTEDGVVMNATDFFVLHVLLGPNHSNAFLQDVKSRQEWCALPAGKPKCKEIQLPTKHPQAPLNSYQQIPNQPTCVFFSILNGLLYFGDTLACHTLQQHLEESTTHPNPLTLVHQLLRSKALKYRITKHHNSTLNILDNISYYPTICILRGFDGETNHAITTVGKWIFDSNAPYAVPLTKENLDWCSSSDDVKVQFHSVQFALRLHHDNPKSHWKLNVDY